MNDYTLQWYRLYAETVPLYKDTCSYMYKKPCNWATVSVDNLKNEIKKIVDGNNMNKAVLNKKIFELLIFCNILGLSGCSLSCAEREQNSALHLTAPPHKHFQQLPGDKLHPAAYFTCGCMKNPCSPISYIGHENLRLKTVKHKSFNSHSLGGSHEK